MGKFTKAFTGAKNRVEDFVIGTVRKYGYPAMGRDTNRGRREEKPAYERSYSPFWIKGIAERQSLVNNSIEEKVNQAFRRGFSDWEKKYAAKCPECKKEFQSLEPFKSQLGEDGNDINDDEIDLDTPRPCPNCEEVTEMIYPKEEDLDRGKRWFRTANMHDYADELLPRRQSSVAQTFRGVCIEVAWDIQTFDDGWMIFERQYKLDNEGNVVGWDFRGAYRVPPYLMRYSTDDGRMGGEYWVCLSCRAKEGNNYQPETSPGPCDECGDRTYEVFAYALDSYQGEPNRFYIQGEFAHDSEYRPTRLYGLSPVVSLADEARTIEQMDDWYRSAYEHRRAPRGAIVVKSSNRQSVKAWNQEQMQKMNADPQHIPVFQDDTDGGGDPIKWQPLLDDPAQMQHMQMREWFLDRIAAKYGVTAVFQKGGSPSTGMSQSLEIVVSNRSAERLQRVFEDTFIPAFLGQLEMTGWTRELRPPEEEDEQEREQLMGRKMSNVRTATQVGFEVEWTEQGDYEIKPDTVGGEEEDGEGGGLGGLFSSDPEPTNSPPTSDEADEDSDSDDDESDSEYSHPSDRPTAEDGQDPAGTTSTTGGRPRDVNETGGQPRDERTPTSDDPYRRGAVTTNTEGFSNPRFGGKPAEVIDVLQDIREAEDAEEAREKMQELEIRWSECSEELEKELPPIEEVMEYAFDRPDKGYTSFKRSTSGDWMSYPDHDEIVEETFRTLRAIN